MHQCEIDEFTLGQVTNLIGYTSTSENLTIAIFFASEADQENREIDKKPVIFKISFTGDKGLFKLSEGYTAYIEEGEVLIQDGLSYLVTDKKELVDE